ELALRIGCIAVRSIRARVQLAEHLDRVEAVLARTVEHIPERLIVQSLEASSSTAGAESPAHHRHFVAIAQSIRTPLPGALGNPERPQVWNRKRPGIALQNPRLSSAERNGSKWRFRRVCPILRTEQRSPRQPAVADHLIVRRTALHIVHRVEM